MSADAKRPGRGGNGRGDSAGTGASRAQHAHGNPTEARARRSDGGSLGTVGLVGLGAMGRGVAPNMIAKGCRLVGYDIRPEMRSWLAGRGGEFAADLADLGRRCPIVVSFVVDDAQTEAVLFGAGGLVGTLAAGTVFVACSTLPPAYVSRLEARLAANGITLIDAPVTGGAAGANKGTLTVMAAGDPAAFERVRPVLATFGERVHHLGPRAGAGAQLKVINQLLCGVHLAAAGEALALARRQGLPLAATLDVLRSGAAASWMLGDRGPRMAAQAFGDVTSAVDIFVKDLGLVLDAARESRFAAPLASAAYNAFLAASGRGMGRWDDSAVICSYAMSPPEGELPAPTVTDTTDTTAATDVADVADVADPTDAAAPPAAPASGKK